MAATTSLNPNAPIYVPSAYLAVDDFSDEWWELIHSSPWFRDYWIRECFYDFQTVESPSPLSLDNATDLDVVSGEKEAVVTDLATLGWLKWRKTGRIATEMPRYFEKAPKKVNVKVSPRPIQQPR